MKKGLKKFFTMHHERKLKEFEALALPLFDQLYTTALNMTKNQFDAEDLVQTAYLKAWRFYNHFEAGTNIRAWMFRILTNTFINEYRVKKREPTRVNFETAEATFQTEESKEIDTNQVLGLNQDYKKLFDDTITAALDDLPEQYRLVVLLSDVSDLKYKEIAEIVGCPFGTVMSRLSRGRKMLARSLKSYAAKNGFTKHELFQE